MVVEISLDYTVSTETLSCPSNTQFSHQYRFLLSRPLHTNCKSNATILLHAKIPISSFPFENVVCAYEYICRSGSSFTISSKRFVLFFLLFSATSYQAFLEIIIPSKPRAPTRAQLLTRMWCRSSITCTLCEAIVVG